MKKSVKLHKMARYLVQRCGLFSWLSSILSFSSDKLFEDKESFFLMQLHVVLEVIDSFPLGLNSFHLFFFYFFPYLISANADDLMMISPVFYLMVKKGDLIHLKLFLCS